MTVYILLLAVFFEGEIHTFHFGAQDKPHPFVAKEACERTLRELEPQIRRDLRADARLIEIRCVERPADGV